MRQAVLVDALILSALALPGVAATPATAGDSGAKPSASEWIAAKKSAARLIASPGSTEGSYRAGVEIRLDPDALTFWRNPGEAGVPPVFNFQDSQNVAKAEVNYPAPQRIDEDGLDAFGYRHFVTFPVEVTLADPRRDAVLSLALDYAVCSKICVPIRAKAELKLPAWTPPAAGSGAKTADDVLDAARAKIPRVLRPEERDARIAVRRDPSAAQPTWRVTLLPGPREIAESAAASDAEPDLFVEAPLGWWFVSKKGDAPQEFTVVELERPSTDAVTEPPPVTVTLAQPRQSFEFALDLNAAAAEAR